MSTKTKNVKNFINQVGKENQLFLFVGSNSEDLQTDAPRSGIDTWKDSDFSVKIGKDNIIGVAKTVKWVKSRIYSAWSSNKLNIGNYYAYNESNGYVYLCLSNNKENRIDYSGKNASTYIPSHISGDVTYGDGYTWKALYRITPSLEKFVTEQWIPVVSFDNFEPVDKTSIFSQIENYCSPSSTKDGGKCAIYFKDDTTYYDGNGNLTVASKGSLYKSFDSLLCYECYNMFINHPEYISIFYGSGSPANSITIKDSYDTIGEMISENKISTASPYYYLYNANKNSPDEGYIVSAHIDLSSYSLDDLKVSTSNPEITINSNTGSGASIRLKTYKGINGYNYINGIEVTQIGNGYKDIQLSLSSGILLGSITSSQLLSNIDINIDEIDGLGFDPMKVLNVEHTMIDVKMDKPTLETSNLSIPSNINFYSLVQNPRYDQNYIAGSDENKYLSTLYRTTTKLLVYTPTENPKSNKTARVTKTDGTIIRNLKVTKVNPSSIYSPTATASLELKGLEYSDINSLASGVIEIDGVSFSIKEVSNYPQFSQYTGTVLSSNKTTSMQIDDVETAIIRINMIKGM